MAGAFPGPRRVFWAGDLDVVMDGPSVSLSAAAHDRGLAVVGQALRALSAVVRSMAPS
jgi:hypothetical protein